MNTYLYLRPSVYLWKGKDHWLFYSMDNNRQFLFARNNETDILLSSLNKFANLYCIKVPADKISEEHVVALLSFVKSNSLGDVVEAKPSERPVSFPPLPFFPDNPLKKTNHSDDILEVIQELTVHLTGICGHKCRYCRNNYRQMNFCTSSKSCLDKEDMARIGDIIDRINVKKLNVIMTEPYDSDLLERLFDKAAMRNTLCCYSVNWKNIVLEQMTQIHRSCPNVLFKVLIDLEDISEDQIMSLMSSLFSVNGSIIYVFVLHKKKDEKMLYRIIETIGIEDYEAHCVSDGLNGKYLDKNYYFNESDLKALKCSSKEILANKFINRNLYGKVVISSYGEVSFSENSKRIGRLDDDIVSALNTKYLSPASPWFLTRERKHKTCGQCHYRYMCPPISDVELYMKRPSGCERYMTEANREK